MMGHELDSSDDRKPEYGENAPEAYSLQAQTQETEVVSTQQLTQSTQAATQEEAIWAALVPLRTTSDYHALYLPQKKYSIGRAYHNDIQIRDRKVSNSHCNIQLCDTDQSISQGERLSQGAKAARNVSGPLIILQDVSTNGTFVNGARIKKGAHALLRPGDQIVLGRLDDPGVRFLLYVPRQSVLGKTRGEGFHQHYALGQTLGNGSHGEVQLCIALTTGQQRACKIVKRRQLRSENVDAMIRREIDLLQHMQHPHIVQFVAGYLDDDAFYIVMEYMAGGDLHSYMLHRTGGLPELEARHITVQILQALAYCAKQGILHRDMKPENILLTTHSPPIVKITDFSLARFVDTESVNAKMTLCGTPAYLAPEILAPLLGQSEGRSSSYDHKVDMWALGVILFALLSCRQPFSSHSECDASEESNVTLYRHILQYNVQWSHLKNKDCSRDVIDFLSRLLKPNPSQRLSAKEALAHPWIKSHYTYSPDLPDGSQGRGASSITLTQSDKDESTQSSTQLILAPASQEAHGRLSLNKEARGRPKAASSESKVDSSALLEQGTNITEDSLAFASALSCIASSYPVEDQPPFSTGEGSLRQPHTDTKETPGKRKRLISM